MRVSLWLSYMHKSVMKCAVGNPLLFPRSKRLKDWVSTQISSSLLGCLELDIGKGHGRSDILCGKF
jgi:hypothetical protein